MLHVRGYCIVDKPHEPGPADYTWNRSVHYASRAWTNFNRSATWESARVCNTLWTLADDSIRIWAIELVALSVCPQIRVTRACAVRSVSEP